MSARDQFHVLRRLGAMSGAVAECTRRAVAAGGIEKVLKDPDVDVDVLAEVAAPLLEGLSRMSDADADFVLTTCQACVLRQVSGGVWAPVVSGGHHMFADMPLDVQLRLVGHVLAEKLGSFFGGLLSGLLGPERTGQPSP